MGAQNTFITVMCVLLIFNVTYALATPDVGLDLLLGGALGLITTGLVAGVVSGINILGSGLTGVSVRLLFGVATLLNILFKISIAGFDVGLGLASNVIEVLGTELMGLGFIVGGLLAMLGLATGLMMIIGGE